MDDYEVGLALNHIEKFFWNFCDNYIEIVKHRLYRPEEFGAKARYSGQKTVYTLLYKLIQNFSIFFPYITEEIYQGVYNSGKSIHLTPIEISNIDYKEENELGDSLVNIISEVRGEKTKHGVSLKRDVKILDLSLSNKLLRAIDSAIADFKATTTVDKLILNEIEKNYRINSVVIDLND